jgi:hypothetical protein
MCDDAVLVAQQCQPTAEEHQRRFATLAQVADEASPERHQPVLTDAVRRREEPAFGTPLDDLRCEDPLGNQER